MTLRVCSRLSSLVLTAALLASGSTAQAADTPITWDFGPTPTSVSIFVNDTVTWNGDMDVHPLRTTDAAFASNGPTVSSGGVSYVRTFSAPGTYYFKCFFHGGSMRTTVVVTCPPTPPTLAVLDIDGNGAVEATTDGLLTLRYMLGLRGAALTAGALGSCASRNLAAIESYLASRVIP